MIAKCKAKCVHKGQDELHGHGNRVLNHVPESKGNKVKPESYRCTVCGTSHERGEARKE